MWVEAQGKVPGIEAEDRHRGARPTYAEIDLSALAHNLRCVRAAAGSAQVYAVVKADAYGHGLIPVARRLEQEGVDGICVALAEEGFRLRDAQVEAPILVLNGAYGDRHAEVLRAGLTPVIYDLSQAQAFAAAAAGRPVAAHLKVDTGMTRLGVGLDQLDVVLRRLRQLPSISLTGLMTHLSSADSDPAFTRLQLERFDAAAHRVRSAGFGPLQLHAANSAGVYASVDSHRHIVRPGLALYGISPLPAAESGAEPGDPGALKPGSDPGALKPAMRVQSEVLSLREVPGGVPVGYNQSFRTVRPSRIACVPIGYGDGYLRALSNRGAMLVGGRRCNIVGRVSMDLTMLDVTDVHDVKVGDEVVVLGRQGDASLDAWALAEAAGTIAYEVVCNMSARVPRHYVGQR